MFVAYVQEPLKRQLILGLEERINQRSLKEINEEFILTVLKEISPSAFQAF
jgi:hypothetical protein